MYSDTLHRLYLHLYEWMKITMNWIAYQQRKGGRFTRVEKKVIQTKAVGVSSLYSLQN
jgi:hypothetical protein